MTPQDAAQRRLLAIQSLQDQLAGNVAGMDRELLEGLLSRLQDIQTNPAVLSELLDEFTANVHLPVLTFAGQALLQLPNLTLSYFGNIGVEAARYETLRAPLASYLQTVFGVDATGSPVPGGVLYTYAGNATVKRALLTYAYQAQLSGAGLNEYRKGLTELVTGTADSGGLYEKLHAGAYDEFNRADRVLHSMAAEDLGFQAYLYLGGLIQGSRAFCKVRNGKVFLKSEIERFGTPQDSFGGYTNKAAGEFSGKKEPYTPLVDLGGHSCRHGLNALDNATAMALRPELREDEKGMLVVGNAG